jgi:hypothetical protein
MTQRKRHTTKYLAEFFKIGLRIHTTLHNLNPLFQPNYVTLVKKYFDACKKYDRASNRFVVTMIELAETQLDQEFPVFSTKQKVRPLDANLLGNALGLLNGIYNVDLLFKFSVKPLQKHFYLENPYSIYLDQPHLTFDQAWYAGPKANDTTKLLKGEF